MVNGPLEPHLGEIIVLERAVERGMYHSEQMFLVNPSANLYSFDVPTSAIRLFAKVHLAQASHIQTIDRGATTTVDILHTKPLSSDCRKGP